MLEQSPSNATDVWCHVRAQESRGCMGWGKHCSTGLGLVTLALCGVNGPDNLMACSVWLGSTELGPAMTVLSISWFLHNER